MLAAALSVAVLAVYAPAMHFDFVNYDDNDYVYANPRVTGGITSANLLAAVTESRAGHWHPLTWWSHMADVHLFGLEPGRHHATNVALHWANVLLLFLVLSAMTGSTVRSALVAGLFAIHPINVESVAWITQRKNLLVTFFWLLTLAAYLRWTRRSGPRDFVMVCAAFVAGLMSKAMIVTLPATLLILDVWPLRRLNAAMLRDAAGRRQAATIVLEKVPLLVLSGIASWVAYASQRAVKAVDGNAVPVIERLLNTCVSYLWYVQKAIVPTGLTVIHPLPSTVGEVVSRPYALLSVLVFGSLTVWAIREFERRPYIAVGVGWYFVTLLPVSGIVQIGAMAHGDHFAYVPLIGVFTAIVWGVADALYSPRAQVAGLVAAGLVIIVLAGVARHQLGTWRNSGTLYARALEVHPGPNPVARKNLAAYYSELGARRKAAGDLVSALGLYHEASTLHLEAGVLYNEAAVLSDLHRYAEAVPLYRRSLELEPSNADAWLNRGDAEVMTGDYATAAASYRRVLALRSDKYAYYGLSYACAHIGDRECAAAAFEQVRLADPSLAGALAAQLN